MNDLGLIFILILGLLGGFQLLINFFVAPLIKKRKHQEFHMNLFLVILIFLYLAGIIVSIILASSGFFKYYE